MMSSLHSRALAILIGSLLALPASGLAQPAPNPALVAIPDNTWTRLFPRIFDANNQEITSSGLPWNSYSGTVYNPDIGGIMMFGGGGHGARRGNDIWIYDTARNEWRQQYAPDPESDYPSTTFDDYCNSTNPATCNPSAEWLPRGSTRTDRPWTSHSYDQMAYDATNHKFVFYGPNFTFGSTSAYYYGVPDAFEYDVATKQWAHHSTYPNLHHQLGSAEYDPQNRLIVAAASGFAGSGARQVWVYDTAQKQWSRRGDAPKQFHDANMVYDTVNRTMLIYGGDYPASDRLFRYTAGTDVWTEVFPLADPVYGRPPAGAPYAAFDSRNGVMLIWGEGDEGSFIPSWAYSVGTNRWQKLNPLTGEPATSSGVGSNLTYDPVNNVFFLLRSTGLWAYRYKYILSTDVIPPDPPSTLRAR